MARDPDVIFFGEDVAKRAACSRPRSGSTSSFGPRRVRDTPISEQAILGAAMGAAMTGLKPIAEIMFSDFFAVCFDYIANEFPKSRYMSNGQVKCPLVVRTGNGAGSRFGAQHFAERRELGDDDPRPQGGGAVDPRDVVGLMAAAVRDPDPVIFHREQAVVRPTTQDGWVSSGTRAHVDHLAVEPVLPHWSPLGGREAARHHQASARMWRVAGPARSCAAERIDDLAVRHLALGGVKRLCSKRSRIGGRAPPPPSGRPRRVGVDGATTLRPGIIIAQFSTLWRMLGAETAAGAVAGAHHQRTLDLAVRHVAALGEFIRRYSRSRPRRNPRT